MEDPRITTPGPEVAENQSPPLELSEEEHGGELFDEDEQEHDEARADYTVEETNAKEVTE
jgi:hypothetical protein